MSGVRRAELCRTHDLAAHLVHYAPGLQQPVHEHARAQLSFLILGDLHETVGRNEADVSVQASGIKPSGVRHGARFGRQGALMLAVDFSGDAPHGLDASEPCRWTALSGAAVHLLHAAIRHPGDKADVLWDLAALSRSGEAEKRKPPGWLRNVREEIADAPSQADIAVLAAKAGVHRVHLSRSFQAAYGLPPSLYKIRSMAARALTLAAESRQPLAGIAMEAGFADQSHLTRAVRRYTGLPPSRLRSLFAEVTSVQDAGRARP
ncbi:MAG TPA: helix-turn-helix transcriptional regulator [Allosphingosinicella sp.]